MSRLSRHLEKGHLNMLRHRYLDLKQSRLSRPLSLTQLQPNWFLQPKILKVCIFVENFIETLNLNICKACLDMSRMSRNFEKGNLNMSRHLNLYLNLSGWSRPSSLTQIQPNWFLQPKFLKVCILVEIWIETLNLNI